SRTLLQTRNSVQDAVTQVSTQYSYKVTIRRTRIPSCFALCFAQAIFTTKMPMPNGFVMQGGVLLWACLLGRPSQFGEEAHISRCDSCILRLPHCPEQEDLQASEQSVTAPSVMKQSSPGCA
ncbi:hypothetical protein HaLaN_11603, partial [Haematococcus lacustris]